MRKTQSLITEYILLILLSIAVLGYTLLWFNQNKSIFSNFLIKNQIEDTIKVIDNYIYNFEGIKYAKQVIVIDQVKGLCEGNVTLLQTEYTCPPSPKSIPFQGYIVNINGSLYIYSNRTKVYYPMVAVGYYIYKSCYEGFETYVINTTECKLACTGRCDISIIKNDSILEIR